MSKKIRVAVVFGGRSAEHEVSLQSARNIVAFLNRDKYEIVLIGVGKNGQWYLYEESSFLLNEQNPKEIKLRESDQEIAVMPGKIANQFINIKTNEYLGEIDVIFPIIHGPFGEDGTLQGLLKLSNIAYVGAGVLGSAVGMDKDVMKRLLRDAGIPVAKFEVLSKYESSKIDFAEIANSLGLPLFVKPANMGSSVGVSKVKNQEEFEQALTEAFRYDFKVIIEENIVGREIECSVLGNFDPVASVPGEILPRHDFYSYEAKYIDENGAVLEIPAKISEEMQRQIKKRAVEAYRALCCEGMARVDLFLKDNGQIVINEINTLPGFTKISMYPKLWEASGIPYGELLDKLIELALERFQKEQELMTSC